MHFLSDREPPIYLDYVLINDGARDVEFQGQLLSYAYIYDNDLDTTELMRIFETRRGSMICHKLLKTSVGAIQNQHALVSNDPEEIIGFFGLSAEAKSIYLSSGINANQVIE